MKNIVITGASGVVATELISQLNQASADYFIYAITTHYNHLRKRYSNNTNIECLDLEEFAKKKVHIDVVLHCAFARNGDGKQISSSLQYTQILLDIIKEKEVDYFVYISSQSVYDGNVPSPRDEKCPISPNSIYALGKYAGELLTDSSLSKTSIRYTSLRLASVGNSARFLNVFVTRAMAESPIIVMGGGQKTSFIDVRDVASALKGVIDHSSTVEFEHVYNLGANLQRDILSLAYDVKRIVEKEYGRTVEIVQQPSDLHLDAGMDSSLFFNTFSWHPQYDYDDMIRSLIDLNLKR